jgi:bifunctional non-homologous end joining protein LigD
VTAAGKLAADHGAPVADVDGRTLSPMLCSQDESAARILAQPGWLYELKLDGVRIVADKRGDAVTLSYRKKRDATKSYPEIAAALAALPEPRVVLDGEIVAFDDEGMPDFQRLAQRIHTEPGKGAVGVVYVVFDVLAIGDRDLRALPLEARKAILARVVPEGQKGAVRLHPTFDDGEALFRLCHERDLEGVVAKRAGSKYRPGERSPDGVKVKHEREADFVVVGWTEGEGRRARLGALDLASYEGTELVVRGAVGSGLDERTIDVLLKRLRELEIATPAAAPRAPGRWSPGKHRRYVKPEIVVSVRYMSFTPEGVLRFPVFRGVRADLRPEDCTTRPGEPQRHLTAPTATVLPDGTTKDALCKYYERVAEALLPYVEGRTSILVRSDGPLWPLPRWTPSWVKTAPAHAGERDVRGVIVDGIETLLFAVEAGGVSLLATPFAEGAPGIADYLVFRADRAAARAVREVTHAIGLEAFPKHAGKGAIDVLVPIGRAPLDVARALAALVARLAAEQAGSPVVAVESTLAPWAVLVEEGRAKVAAPLAWGDLDADPPALADADPSRDPMRPMLDASADVARAAQALERYVSERSR